MTFKKLFKKGWIFWLCIGAAVVVAALVLWCYKLNMNPERVFWKTIEKGLATQAVTIEAEQTSNGIKADQVIRYSLGGNNLSHSLTTLSQKGTTVQTEMVGTSTVDYTRYVSIKTDQKKPDGSAMNFSKVIGIWSVGDEGSGQFFAQAVFGAALPVGGLGVPIGNVSPKMRADLVKQIKHDDVYKITFNKAKKQRVDGRLQYTYEATMRPSAYVALMKKYSQDLGLHGLDQLDPSDYKTQPEFKLLITVDAHARQVVKITEPKAGSKQTYTDYGIPVQPTLPKSPIATSKLTQLLSEAQQ